MVMNNILSASDYLHNLSKFLRFLFVSAFTLASSARAKRGSRMEEANDVLKCNPVVKNRNVFRTKTLIGH